MTSIGIIAEFNPFHNGHKYLIEEAKKRYPESTIVLVLNSSFLERGEISIMHKWDKTDLALRYGIDLVVELPFCFGSQSADIFAEGAIQLLKELKVDKLFFGSESNDIHMFHQLANIQKEHPKYPIYVKDFLAKGMNYPTACAKALEKICHIKIENPNDLLALSYIKAIVHQKADIEAVTIQRTNHYHEQVASVSDTIASASSIRNLLKQNKDITPYVPKETISCIHEIDQDLFFDLLKAQIITHFDNLNTFQTVEEGIDSIIRKHIYHCSNLNELISALKSKRFTYNKIHRMIIHILTHFTKEEASYLKQIEYIRILGMNQRGKKYLHDKKKEFTLPIITKYKTHQYRMLDLEYRVTSIYAMLICDPALMKRELQNKPVIL